MFGMGTGEIMLIIMVLIVMLLVIPMLMVVLLRLTGRKKDSDDPYRSRRQ